MQQTWSSYDFMASFGVKWSGNEFVDWVFELILLFGALVLRAGKAFLEFYQRVLGKPL